MLLEQIDRILMMPSVLLLTILQLPVVASCEVPYNQVTKKEKVRLVLQVGLLYMVALEMLLCYSPPQGGL